MKFILLLLSIWLVFSPTAEAQDKARGVVYSDENGNGQFDSDEKVLQDVAVSNGRDVVLTDNEGKYELPISEDTILFVIKPSGYDLPVNDLNQPQFFYIHKPGGSPELEYPGVDPTGSLPESVDFGLIKRDEQEEFRMLVFGDPQPYNEKEVDYFDRDIVDELADAEGYEFGITLGDIVGDDLDLFKPYSESVSRIGLPWFHVYGNHDMNFDAESDQYADETFEANFGPATYSFNHGKTHFIVFDNVVYPRPDGESGYIGGVTEKQLTFIENNLKFIPKDHQIVLAAHIPLYVPEWRETSDYFIVEDRAKLFEILSDFPNLLSLSAHTHVQRLHFLEKESGWDHSSEHLHYNVGTTGGDWWSGVPDERGIPTTLMRDGTPNGYAIINFNGNTFTLDYKVAGEEESKKMSIWGPEVVPQNEWFNSDFYVNYFLGSDSTKVEFQINGEGNWRKMQKINLGDPFVTSLRDKWDRADYILEGKRPNNAVASSHLWRARVPKNLPEGTQTLVIRVTDQFDREFIDEFTYRIENRK